MTMILSAASVKNSVVLFLIVVSGLSPGLLQLRCQSLIQDIGFEFEMSPNVNQIGNREKCFIQHSFYVVGIQGYLSYLAIILR